MSAEKLTAKLSDGTEWRVDILGGQPNGDMQVMLKPLKPSPPKEVYIRVYSDNSVSATYRTAEEAVVSTRGFSGPSNIHRYILAEEPKPEPKKPREYRLHFYCDGALAKVTPHGSKAALYVNSSIEREREYPTECVDVREVVPDNFNKENV